MTDQNAIYELLKGVGELIERKNTELFFLRNDNEYFKKKLEDAEKEIERLKGEKK